MPSGHYEVELGKARTVREGDDVTLITWGAMVSVCEEAASRLTADGVECGIIDPRTLWPLDIDAIVEAVSQSGRAIIVHEAPRSCGGGNRCPHSGAMLPRTRGSDSPSNRVRHTFSLHPRTRTFPRWNV